jgi:hypothetical protein
MSDVLKKVVTYLLLLALVFWTGFFSHSCYKAKESLRYEQEAKQKEKDYLAAVAKAQEWEQIAKEEKQAAIESKGKANESEQRAKESDQKYWKLKAKYEGSLPPLPPLGPFPEACAPLVERVAVLEKRLADCEGLVKAAEVTILDKDRTIDDKNKAISDFEQALKSKEISEEYWKKAARDADSRANLLQIALEAQKAANRSQRWLGRIEGAGTTGGVWVLTKVLSKR